eukprot:gene8027-5582_t
MCETEEQSTLLFFFSFFVVVLPDCLPYIIALFRWTISVSDEPKKIETTQQHKRRDRSEVVFVCLSFAFYCYYDDDDDDDDDEGNQPKNFCSVKLSHIHI